jgi:serine/threonine protein kinase
MYNVLSTSAVKFEDMHEQLRDIAENLGPLLVDLNQIVLHEVLGEGYNILFLFMIIYYITKAFVNVFVAGAFGLVQKGTLARDGKLSTVAVKSLKDNSSLSSVLEFVQESCMMSALDHPNILSVSAVCLDMSSGQSALILVPYMANGDLRTFLQKSRYNENTDETVRM